MEVVTDDHLLDTWMVAPSDRPDYWSAGIADQFFPMHVESLGSWPLEARLTGRLVSTAERFAQPL